MVNFRSSKFVTGVKYAPYELQTPFQLPGNR